VFNANRKLVDSNQNKYISHTVIKSFEEKSVIEEDSKNAQSLSTYSQKSVLVNSEGIFSLELPGIA
jgi:O-acetyl-ADP-ribose deacetylase (regulator of RNase III)